MYVDENELVRLINEEIEKNESLHGCKVNRVTNIFNPGENEGNWSVDDYSTGRVPHEIAVPQISAIIESLKDKYKLK